MLPSSLEILSKVAQVQGQLNVKPIATVMRLISRKGLSGLLRVTRGRTIKAIFFESGNPVFAISNMANEQLEHKLLQENLVSASQLEQARNYADKSNKLGAALIELGILSQENLNKAVREQAMNIIISLFEWQEGEYVFDEKMRASHEVKLQASTTDILLEGSRLVAEKQPIAEQIAPLQAVVVRAEMSRARLDSGKLTPVESYVLSRVDTPTTIGNVGLISGLPDYEAHRAVCVLVASGFLKLADESNRDEEEDSAQSASHEEIDKYKEEVARRMHYYSNADYYDVLEVTRQASTAEVKAAYYQLAKKYHPDRFHQAEHAELRHKLEAMFTMITRAYETLSNPSSRNAYDQKIRRGDSSPLHQPTTPAIPATSPLSPSFTKPKPVTGNLTKPSITENLEQPVQANGEAVNQPASSSQPSSPPTSAHNAEYLYQQGRSRLEKMDVHAAIHLLREAVKLEPNKGPYHFHLGSALLRSPRNRREAEEHLAKAALLDPFNSQLRLKIGLLFKESGNKVRAEHYFKEALSLDPDNRMAKKELGETAKKVENQVPIWKQDVGSIAKRFFKKS